MSIPAHVRRRYLSGQCFTLAREMHRATGQPLLGLLDDRGDLHHAMIADPVEGFGWDIRGRIRLEDAARGACAKDLRLETICPGDIEDCAGDPDVFDLLEASAVVRDILSADPAWPGQRNHVGMPGPEMPSVGSARELYSQGSCHVFALAALDVLGSRLAPLGLRVVFDADEVYHEAEDDSGDDIHAVVHVYAVLEGDDGPVAVDIFGARPLDAAEAECREVYGIASSFVEDFRDPRDIAFLVDDAEDGTRPLHALTSLDFDEARALLEEMLSLEAEAPSLS